MSTRSEGKDDGEGKCEGKDADASSPKREKFAVVDKVHEFCTSSEFEGSFEEFTKEYSSVILSSALFFVLILFSLFSIFLSLQMLNCTHSYILPRFL